MPHILYNAFMKQLHFPKDFLWGAATALHQVEGDTINDWSEWERANADRLVKKSAPTTFDQGEKNKPFGIFNINHRGNLGENIFDASFSCEQFPPLVFSFVALSVVTRRLLPLIYEAFSLPASRKVHTAQKEHSDAVSVFPQGYPEQWNPDQKKRIPPPETVIGPE